MKLIFKEGLLEHNKKSINYVHCVGADGGMGGGFAGLVPIWHKEQFRSKPRQKLDVILTRERHADACSYTHLCTKVSTGDRPTYYDFIKTIEKFVKFAARFPNSHWHSPLLGCGIDGLERFHVEDILRQVTDQYHILNNTKWTFYYIKPVNSVALRNWEEMIEAA